MRIDGSQRAQRKHQLTLSRCTMQIMVASSTRKYGAKFFGRAAAVINFHRIQRFMVAVIRRMLGVLFSMYFDDATMQDRASAKGRGQRYVRAVFRMMGIPLATEKEVDMCSQNDFLGLVHDVSQAALSGIVRFWPRQRLRDKAVQMLQTMLDKDYCTPAEASKARGVLGFLFTGTFGKVGRGGQQPLLQREYVDTRPYRLSRALKASLEYFLQVQQLDLHREVRLASRASHPLLIASDGRLDDKAPPSIAALMVDVVSGIRLAVVA